MGQSLRFRRTALITGALPSSVWPLATPPSPLAFSYFPLTGGIGLPQRGKLYGRVLDPPLRRIQNGFVFLVGAGPRPARGRTLCASTGETEPGMLVRRRQAQKWDRAGSNFLPAQAPSGAGRNRAQALLILRAGNVLLTSRGVIGVRGKANMSASALILSRPRRRNLPARNETALSSPPHPSGLTASHLPPRGKALCGGAALIRPRGKAYNGRRRNAVSHKILLLTFLLRKVSRWSSLPPEFSHPAPAAPWTSGPPLSAWSAHPQCCGF